MPTIEEAIEQLEQSASKLKELSREESKAINKAVREASKEATSKVKAEYADKRKAARKEARAAEKAVSDARARILRALNDGQPAVATRARKGERDRQFVAYVKDNPNARLADIARGIGIHNSAANGVAKRLIAKGEIKKSQEKTYTLA